MEGFAQPGIGQADAVVDQSQFPPIVRRVEQILVFRMETAQAFQQRTAVEAQASGVVEIAFCVEGDDQDRKRFERAS